MFEIFSDNVWNVDWDVVKFLVINWFINCFMEISRLDSTHVLFETCRCYYWWLNSYSEIGGKKSFDSCILIIRMNVCFNGYLACFPSLSFLLFAINYLVLAFLKGSQGSQVLMVRVVGSRTLKRLYVLGELSNLIF